MYIRINEYSWATWMKEVVKVCQALSDETRLRILNLLGRRELCVCDLMAALKITQSKASRHLSYLKNAGLVQDRREGLWIHYSLCRGNNRFHRALLGEIKTNLNKTETGKKDLAKLKGLMAQGACTASLRR